MVMLVTTAELASHLRVDESDLDVPAAEQAIRTASAWVESTTGLAFTSRTSTVRIPSTWARSVSLPVRPVQGVSSVKIGGTPYTDFTLTADGLLWRSVGWQTMWEPQTVEAVVTYGIQTTPDDVKGVVLEVAEGVYDGNLAVESERIDDYQVSRSGLLSDLSIKTLASYGANVGTTAMRGT